MPVEVKVVVITRYLDFDDLRLAPAPALLTVRPVPLLLQDLECDILFGPDVLPDHRQYPGVRDLYVERALPLEDQSEAALYRVYT